MAALGDRVVFSSVVVEPLGLMVTDGTSVGTRVLTSAFYAESPQFQQVGQRLFVSGEAPNGLWVTDGTPAGTTHVADVPVGDMDEFQGQLYFARPDPPAAEAPRPG